MSLRFDEKGKYYTDYVSKYAVPVVIQTNQFRIRGTLYVREERRLSDELNELETFIPITDAEITDAQGKVNQVSFLAVGRTQIIWVYPEVEEVPSSSDSPDMRPIPGEGE